MPPAYSRNPVRRLRTAALAALASLTAITPALAAPCAFESQGEGRAAAVIDARSFRLSDGREIKLAGIEPVSPDTAKGATALSALLAGREIMLRGDDDAPDRYGRQTAFVFIAGEENSVQATLLAQGEAFAAADIPDKDCAAALLAAESAGRQPKRAFGRPQKTRKVSAISRLGMGALCWWKAGFCLSGRPGQRLTSTSAATGHGISL
jgi:endonuclease YncB( thermonuclease family)